MKYKTTITYFLCIPENCQFYYLVQPPAELSCNPFLDTVRYSARIECVVAVNSNTIGNATRDDFRVRWFGQLGTASEPQELFLDSTFGTRFDLQVEETGAFYIYQSSARVSNVEIGVLDRYWCQIDALEELLNGTELERSDELVIATRDVYEALPFCPLQTFFHKTELKCAQDLMQSNSTSVQPTMAPTPPAMAPPPPSPVICPSSQSSNDNIEAKRLIAVLFPSLALPVFVAILLVISAIVMTCRQRSRKGKSRGKKQGEWVQRGPYRVCLHTSKLGVLQTLPL